MAISFKNKEFWQDFIELYRSFSCLWNVKSKDYSNKQLRGSAYEELIIKCKELFPNADKSFVSKRINNMRTTFRRELKKIEESKTTGTSSDDIYTPTLWYFDLLLFLSEEEVGRPGHSSLEDDDNSYVPDGDIEDDDQRWQASDQETSVDTCLPSPSTSSNTPRSKKKAKTLEQEQKSFLQAASKFITETKAPQADEFDVTGKKISYQLKDLDKTQRLIAEKLISDIIFYGKLGRLTETTSISLQADNSPTANLYHQPQYHPSHVYHPQQPHLNLYQPYQSQQPLLINDSMNKPSEHSSLSVLQSQQSGLENLNEYLSFKK